MARLRRENRGCSGSADAVRMGERPRKRRGAAPPVIGGHSGRPFRTRAVGLRPWPELAEIERKRMPPRPGRQPVLAAQTPICGGGTGNRTRPPSLPGALVLKTRDVGVGWSSECRFVLTGAVPGALFVQLVLARVAECLPSGSAGTLEKPRSPRRVGSSHSLRTTESCMPPGSSSSLLTALPQFSTYDVS
jgi:hypothetical protein